MILKVLAIESPGQPAKPVMEAFETKVGNKYKSLYTLQSFRKGKVICAIKDYKIFNKPNHYTVQISKDKHAYIEKLIALNHSCDPNIILDTQQMLRIAIKEIKKGEELLYFYPSNEWEMRTPFICSCSYVNCLPFIIGARFISYPVLTDYYLNKHILEMLTN